MSNKDESMAYGQSEETDSDTIIAADSERETVIKKRRKQLRAKITRTINRIKERIHNNDQNHRRLKRELEEVKQDYLAVGELHCELYSYADEVNILRLDQREQALTDDVYSIEELVEDFLSSAESQPSVTRKDNETAINGTTSEDSTGQCIIVQEDTLNGDGIAQGDNMSTLRSTQGSTVQHLTAPDMTERRQVIDVNQNPSSRISDNSVIHRELNSFDHWIDKLIEFTETVLPTVLRNITMADALYKLEASKDIPAIQLPTFNGDPLGYVEFIERFKIHIHDKSHLNDDVRMIQLKMHVVGEAANSISGLGSGGIMYPTALKTLKEQFGHPSCIARACVNKITRGSKININDRNSLRQLSLDIINSLATLKRINYYADINASDTLRQIIKRLPDPLISRWKNAVTDIRDKGGIPSIEHISHYVCKYVRSQFDPDFGDIDRHANDRYGKTGQTDRRKGIHDTLDQSNKQKLSCYMCAGDHRVSKCSTFADSTVPERIQFVKEKRLCFSCLTKGHMTKDCRSKGTCKRNGCTRTHHPLLHTEPPSASSALSPLDTDSIMPVVRVNFRSTNGSIRQGNVLIDSGAGTTIIRRDFAKALGLQGKREGLDLSVVGGETFAQPDSRRVKFWLSPLDGNEEFEMEAHEIDKTIVSVPALDRHWLSSFSHLKGIEFPHKAGPVDLILGVQYSHLHVDEETRQGLPFQPVAKRTRLGWYVIGSDKVKRASSINSINFVQRINLDKFYEFETLGIQAPNCSCPQSVMSPDDKKALNMFESSCQRLDNRYVIGLPWKKDPALLPNNYTLARKRLLSLERSLVKCPEKATLYRNCINEYEQNGWACKVTEDELETDVKPVFYLPHHGIYRPDKQSTPLRVVFDPACQYEGVSLNSFLYKGPCLIGNLLGILLRFRENIVAFVGDISKMFLQVCLPEADTHTHRFLWRDMNTSQEPTIYRLLRVTFGDKPSPDMASFAMLRIAEEHEREFPDEADIIRRDRYVDDLIHSCSSAEEAQSRIKGLDRILATGSFKIKEWFCSAESVRDELGEMSQRRSETRSATETKMAEHPVEDGQSKSLSEIYLGMDELKTLGVGWNPLTDEMKFSTKDVSLKKFTKRNILSKMSTLYDPLGLVSAVTIKARVAMQNIWRSKQFGWDDVLPDELCDHWMKIFEAFEELGTLRFPRCLKPTDALGSSELHVFADASVEAYGAVAYLLWPTDSSPVVRLVAVKARVAPLRQTTIPRLELMAALIASRLAKTIVEKPGRVIFWSDSQIVLHWLQSESITLKAFVGVRVSEIQSSWDSSNWRFVPSELNPADDVSRGISVENMNGRWMNGPAFLKQTEDKWPVKGFKEQVKTSTEELKKPKTMCAVIGTTPLTDPERYSSWRRLVRVTAYCLRFVKNAQLKVRLSKRECNDNYLARSLQPEEVERAERHWIKYAQREMIDWESRFRDLAPFVRDGVIRVGGRLRHSGLLYDQIHPILLPGSNAISNLIMTDVHRRMGHPGTEKTLSQSRRSFWIIRGRNLAKKVVRECTICRKLRQPSHSTLLADLPANRLRTFSPPFSVTGVDLFGPFLLKYGRNKSIKAWGALFTCSTVRAIHLEIVADLSTQAFLQALRRFVAHHGWPHTIISDNGSSFIGVQRELKKLVQEGRKQIENFASLHKVKWLFNTPLSPHQGGIFESLIKQTKRALQVAIGQQVLSWNDLSTVFAEAECLINSRPIGYAANDPNDLQPLTPNHFLLGRASVEVPQGPFEETANLRKRFEFVQVLVHQFWKRFVREYIPTLMKRSKWQVKGRQMKVGDIVLLTDPVVPRGKWNLARILEVYPGQDGVVRNVRVRTSKGEFKRSIQRCCPILEISDENPSSCGALEGCFGNI